MKLSAWIELCVESGELRLKVERNTVLSPLVVGMGGRAVDCARLESVCSLTGTQGSNPCPSEFLAKTLRSSGLIRRLSGLVSSDYHVRL